MSYTMYKHHLTVIVWPAVKKPQQWFTSAGTYISRLYRRELLFLVDGNKEDQPATNKVAICGVRPADTMQSVAASSVAASLEIRTLSRSCSVTRCPEYNALTPVTRIVARACSCQIPRNASGWSGVLWRGTLPDFWESLQVLLAAQKDYGAWHGRPSQPHSKFTDEADVQSIVELLEEYHRTNPLTEITVMRLSAAWLGSMRGWAKIERSCCTSISSARSR